MTIIPNLELAIEFCNSGQSMKDFGKSKESALGVKTQRIRQRIIKACMIAINRIDLDPAYCNDIFRKNNYNKDPRFLAILNYAKDYSTILNP